MVLRKTHTQFLSQLKENNPWFTSGYFTLEGEYVSAKKGIIVRTEYGLCRCSVERLVSGAKPLIKGALDKNEYFSNQLLKKNTHYKRGDFTVIGKYTSVNDKILVKTKYGFCKPYGVNLLKGHLPEINSAINPTEYWVRLAREKRGLEYDYSRVEYKAGSGKVLIGCKIHGTYFSQEAAAHLMGQGCPTCGKESTNHISDFSDSRGTFYLLRCYSEKEEFLKIGHTIKTVRQRYPTKKSMPYKYSVERLVEGPLKDVLRLELEIKEVLKGVRYEPEIHFKGSKTEVFSMDTLDNINSNVEEVFYINHWYEYMESQEECCSHL